MKSLGLVIAVIAFGLVCSLNTRSVGADAKAKVRIGVYDSRAIAVAYLRSAKGTAHLKELAKTAKPEEMERRQTVAHLQGFGNLPVDDILAEIKGDLPKLAADANVSAIVCHPGYLGDDVETVDITDALVKTFQPDAKTLKVIDELKKHPPMDAFELLGHQD